MEDRSDDPSHRERSLFTTELHLAPVLTEVKVLTQQHNVKRQLLTNEHDHALRMPEVTDVRQEVADALHCKAVTQRRDPQPPEPAAVTHS